MSAAVDALLEKVRARKLGLPLPAERRRIREQAGVSLRDMAEALGVSQQAPFRWEQGATPRDLKTVVAYGELLVELEKILRETKA